MPYSPKVTRVPPLAAPLLFGWCCLRCLTRRGISIGSALLGCGCGRRSRWLGGNGLGCHGRLHRLGGGGFDRCGRGLRRRCAAVTNATVARTTGRTVTTRAAVALVASAQGSLRRLLLARHDLVALIDPDLHADPAESGAGLVETEVDVGPQGVQRHPTLAVELRPGHLGTTETARALHPDPLRTALERGLHRLAHRATERHPAGQLLGHALRDELGVDLRGLDLEDVEVDVLAGQLLEIAADAVGLRAPSADDDARPRGVDVDVDPVTGALDLDPADAGAL